MKSKTVLFFLALFVFNFEIISVLKSQNSLIVSLPQKETNQFELNGIKKFSFEDGKLVIANQAGTQDSFLINGVQKIHFGENISTNESIIAEHEEMVIYPNPASEYFNIRLNENLDKSVTVQLLNMQGQTIWQNNLIPEIDRIQINLETLNLPSGIYICTIKTPQAQFSKPLIIQ